MADENMCNMPQEEGKLDFLTQILLDGQELEISFSSLAKTNFEITGTILIKEQSLFVKPRRGVVNSPQTEAWMCTHPKYWKILCGLEPADVRTNIKIMGMLVRAGLYELSQMMMRRIDVMLNPSSDGAERPMCEIIQKED